MNIISVSQAAAEVIRGSTQSLSVSQVAVDVIRGSTQLLSISQVAVEVVRPNVDTPTTSPHRPQISACP